MLMHGGDLESSRNHFLNSLEINPNYAKSYFNYGLLLVLLEDVEEAKNNFDKVIEIDQNYAPAYFNKARLLISPDDFEDAKKIIKRHWTLTKIIWMQAIIWQSCILVEKRRIKKARSSIGGT